MLHFWSYSILHKLCHSGQIVPWWLDCAMVVRLCHGGQIVPWWRLDCAIVAVRLCHGGGQIVPQWRLDCSTVAVRLCHGGQIVPWWLDCAMVVRLCHGGQIVPRWLDCATVAVRLCHSGGQIGPQWRLDWATVAVRTKSGLKYFALNVKKHLKLPNHLT